MHQALYLVESARTSLHAEVDLLLSARLEGLESKIRESLGEPNRAEPEKANRLESSVHQNVLRRGRGLPARRRAGEDPLGDLIDLIYASSEIPADARELELWTLLRGRLSMGPGARAIVFGVVDDGALLVDRAEIRRTQALSRTHREILAALASGPKSNGQLISTAWGYEYHPLRHNPLLYSAIRSLRQRLEADWIESSADGYRLLAGVEVVSHLDRAPARTSKGAAEFPSAPRAFAHRRDLNARQNEILNALTTGCKPHWAPRDSRETFGVSTMTATRDLSDMSAKGMIRRLGRGRATYYALP